MSDYSSLGARMTRSNWDDEALQQEMDERVRADALEAFLNLNPVPDQLIRQLAVVEETLLSGQRLLRDHVNWLLMRLVEDDLMDNADMEIVSEHLCRRLGDAHSAADALNHLHTELLSFDLNAILKRYKG